jgi:hypothetical protein
MVDDARRHNAQKPDLAEIMEVARAVVDKAEQAKVLVRLIGGVAIAMHAADDLEHALRRTPDDIDVVAHKSARSKLDGVFARAGFAPDRRFNALNGAERRVYYSDLGVKADVFVGAFRMCHVIPIDGKRLALDHPTAPLAELLMTKAQVVRLTRKDTTDLIAIMRDHDVGDHDDGVINAAWIAELCARDWGLWRTVSETLRRVTVLVHDVDVDHRVRERVGSRVEHVLAAIDRAPKSQKWKMRNRIGDRMTWYELPEDPTRAPETVEPGSGPP